MKKLAVQIPGITDLIGLDLPDFKLEILLQEDTLLNTLSGDTTIGSVFFRTESENNYRVTQKAPGTINAGKWVVQNGRTQEETPLTFGEMHFCKLDLGKKFYFGNFMTTRVKQVVVVTSKKCDPAEKLSSSLMIGRFYQMMKRAIA